MYFFKSMSRFKMAMFTMAIALSIASLPCVALAEAVAETGTEPELLWVIGSGQKIELGQIAQLTLKQDYGFLDGENTKQYVRSYGSIPSEREIGAVFPASEDQQWVAYFEYTDSGHIEDKEKDKIDADALLESYRKGTEQVNKEVSDDNKMFVDRWFVEPSYNESLHSLTWSILFHDINNEDIINYNIRMLTREGYVSAILVSDPEHLEADRKVFESQIISNFSVKPGETYSDFDPATDKKAEYGLTGLILGGVGLLAAKKAGLIAVMAVFLKKFWFVIILPFMWLWRVIRGKSKKNEESAADEPSPNENIPS
ncbi:hypothetical protein GCM10010918_02440 [Paenibacillus radicis (ex Gao et al. 2016)]|uniref:DUF2167 domain-containing protein n=2 Tax=Paenibacillus radicis (ex Gao et al. 2016) TaxID=1737354 RepID=A0A917LRT1_9BACL|nr:hypothetical protein GCM10010918_02440 [Paenibacillus radicis (ex Gao et al. 2016)]